MTPTVEIERVVPRRRRRREIHRSKLETCVGSRERRRKRIIKNKEREKRKAMKQKVCERMSKK